MTRGSGLVCRRWFIGFSLPPDPSGPLRQLPPAQPSLGTLQDILLVVPVVLFSFVAHEYAHGWAAWKQGDRTAHDLGLLNWDPRTYVDPFMTLILPLLSWVGTQGQVILGGARSAPLNPANYRHPRLGDIIVSLAGVTANLIVAVLCTVLFVLCGLAGRAGGALETSMGILQAMCVIAIRLNLFLILFNLLPIPPLDGSHVVKNLLPPRLAAQYMRLARFGFLVLILLVYFGANILGVWLRPAILVAQTVNAELSDFQLSTTSQWLPWTRPRS
jgi:Zn-dependent protease